MFCSVCGRNVKEEANFCDNCGSNLELPDSVTPYEYTQPPRGRRREPDPYKDQIAQLRLQLKQMKLYQKRITTQMSNTRAQYHETAAFIPHGLLRRGYKWFEDLRLLGPQQQKQQLQQQILQLEQQLIGLQQAQMEWRMQRSS